MAGYFPAHPYEHDRGYMLISYDTLPEDSWWRSYTHSFRFTTEFGTNFDNQQLLGGKMLWEHTSRWGWDARCITLREQHATEDNDVWLGDTNVLIRFAQHEKWQFRGGVGLNWFAEDARADLGVNFTYGVDCYPMRPLILSSEVDIGTLGKSYLFHWQTTCGVHWRGVETYVGYDYADIGPAQFNMFLCGIRGWF
jgi:hypothetical protein